MDGTTVPFVNTPVVQRRWKKAKSRHMSRRSKPASWWWCWQAAAVAEVEVLRVSH